ncbi:TRANSMEMBRANE PROTEIN 41A [Ceraceosorus bombacis]|uniref:TRANSMEMBRANE PROTEIN 41A n=1 Tax=Ceraceosorus bombacis TaxID=401625 RepID=A0A0P1BFX4_9BASI|nr:TRANSMEMBRANE PROTEIN 41A [Ceraceosorus bombacis]
MAPSLSRAWSDFASASASSSSAGPSSEVSTQPINESVTASSRRVTPSKNNGLLAPIQTPRHPGSASPRSRARSIGRMDASESDRTSAAKRSSALLHLQDPDRGPGTPDFTLSSTFRSPRDGEARLAQSAVAPEIGQNQHGLALPAFARPRLSSLRSLFGVFGAAQSSEGRLVEQPRGKLRSSMDGNEEVGGATSSSRYQGLTASAEALASDEVPDAANRHARRPTQLLAMPAARQAGPSGLLGLNDDSPPLTPSSEGAHDTTEDDLQHGARKSLDVRHHYHTPKHHWSAAQAAADRQSHATLTPTSSVTSGRLSPVFSTVSADSNGTFSPPTRPGSSAPPHAKASTGAASLLPSHIVTPPSSPRGAAQQLAPSTNVPFAAALASSPADVFVSLPSRAKAAFASVQLPPIRPHLPALLFLLIAFVGSTICIVLGLSTLPMRLPKHITGLTIEEIKDAVLPIVPYGAMNLACGCLGVPLLPYAVTLAVGSVGWNFTTASIGVLLLEAMEALPTGSSETLVDTLASGGFSDAKLPGSAEHPRLAMVAHKAKSGAAAIAEHLWTPTTIARLVLLSLVSLAPIVVQRYLKHRKQARGAMDGENGEEVELEVAEREDSDIEMDAIEEVEDDSFADASMSTLRGGAGDRSFWLKQQSQIRRAVAVPVVAQQSLHSPVLFDEKEFSEYFEDEGEENAQDTNPYDAIVNLQNRVRLNSAAATAA